MFNVSDKGTDVADKEVYSRSNSLDTTDSANKLKLNKSDIYKEFYQHLVASQPINPYYSGPTPRNMQLSKEGVKNTKSIGGPSDSPCRHIEFNPDIQESSHDNSPKTKNPHVGNASVPINELNHVPQSKSLNQTPEFKNSENKILHKNNTYSKRNPISNERTHYNFRPPVKNDNNQFYEDFTNHWKNAGDSFPSQPPLPYQRRSYEGPFQPPPKSTNTPSEHFSPPLNSYKKTQPSYSPPHFNMYDDPQSHGANHHYNLPQLPDQGFTGYAGYNWPTKLKTIPKDELLEEENMRVYTKPSFSHTRTYAFDFIKKALRKYTSRLKQLIFKNFPKEFEIKASHLETAEMEREQNIYPGQQLNKQPA